MSDLYLSEFQKNIGVLHGELAPLVLWKSSSCTVPTGVPWGSAPLCQFLGRAEPQRLVSHVWLYP